jgi:hypothetical protein
MCNLFSSVVHMLLIPQRISVLQGRLQKVLQESQRNHRNPPYRQLKRSIRQQYKMQ